MMMYVFSGAIGMVAALILFLLGYEYGRIKMIRDRTEYLDELIGETIDDFPRTLDGKFFSREMAIKNMSMKDGD